MHIQSLARSVFALALITVAACGDDGDTKMDAQTQQLTCDSYCTSVMTNCTGTNQQFASMANCMTSCSHYPVGAAADTSGNTLGCRTYHAGMPAMMAPDTHCRHAGPGGNGACGADCLGFCTLVLGSCTGANVQFGGDMATCMTACNGYATTPAYSSSVTTGNSFACRLYHATVASGDPAGHCGHTSSTGTPPCN